MLGSPCNLEGRLGTIPAEMGCEHLARSAPLLRLDQASARWMMIFCTSLVPS